MIDVARLTKTYGDFTAVKDFLVPRRCGRNRRIDWPNGAGKTSTLRSIAGIHAPTAGAITIDGRNIVANPVEAKQRLAFIADEPQLFEYLTVTEHLRLVSRIIKWPTWSRGPRRCWPSSS
jgi:ABC-2 type transport system ATP-binding protein